MQTSRTFVGGWLIAVFALVGCSGGACLPGDDSGGSVSTESSSVVDSALLAGRPIVAGTVRHADGQPMVGAPVLLLVHSPEPMEVGERRRIPILAQTTSGPNGEFELRIENLADLVPLADGYGLINFEVTGFDSSETAVFGFPRRLVGSGTDLHLAMTDGDESAAFIPEAPTEIVDLVALTSDTTDSSG